ncbi:MAG: tetratricopeptide repeat protein [Methanoregula sp.]|nr:tetratricopeptide repeat protein [Methanoregula sp.]
MRADCHPGIIAGFIFLLILLTPVVTAADLADQYYADGINFSSRGQYAEAVAAYDKAVFIRPGNADAWNNRGVALENLGQYSEAVSSYDRAVILQPGYAGAWYNRGVALRKMGRYADAVISYDKALAINPSYPEAWLNRGVALDYLGRYDESVASYDKALALQPDFAPARENRELALSKKDRLNPAVIGAIIFVVIIVVGLVIWQLKSRPGTGKAPELPKPEQLVNEERRPVEKKLVYGTIPEEGELQTLASLCGIINIHGRSILDQPDKVAQLLNELSHGDFERERNALVVGLKENIPQELLKTHKGFTWVSTPTRLKKLLKEKHGMSDELAEWVIETWAKALEMEV